LFLHSDCETEVMQSYTTCNLTLLRRGSTVQTSSM